MRKWELEVAGNQLLDVGTLDVGGVLDLDDFEDLRSSIESVESLDSVRVRIWRIEVGGERLE